ncbi:ribosomal biogenesis protein [Encephalitozoon hellem]|nr:ribosomal biogenesis protein [Encephalitozoon hellem]
MRDLKQEEEKEVLKKLKFFIGDNVHKILSGEDKLFLHNQRVMLLPEKMRAATSMISRKSLVIAGTVIGKFTKSGSFRLGISSLNFLSRWAIYKVWIKNSAEMNYVYGNNSLKSHIFRSSEGIPINAGVFVFNQNDVPLGFGITALTPQGYTNAKGHALVLLRQSDTGEYVRNEGKV